MRPLAVPLSLLVAGCYPPIDALVTDDPQPTSERTCTLPAEVSAPPSFPDTAYPRLTGASHVVSPGDDLQAVVDAAAPGDEIVLQAGAEYPGPLVLSKQEGAPIVVRSSALGELVEGRRVTLDDVPRLATILASDSEPALIVGEAATGYRIAGLELRPPPGVAANVLVQIGSGASTIPEALPTEIVIDRTLVRGDPAAGARTGIELDTRASAIVDSSILDIKRVEADARGLSIDNATGPILVHNVVIEAAWQNVAIGEQSPGAPELFPSDIALCKTRLSKPAAWFDEAWETKSLVEIVRGRRILVADSLLERSLSKVQQGYGFYIEDAGTPAGLFTEDIAIVNVRMREVEVAFQLSPDDAGIRRLAIENADLMANGSKLVQLYGGGIESFSIVHVTGAASHGFVNVDGAPNTGFVLRDGLFDKGTYGLFGSGVGDGIPALDTYFPGWTMVGNVVVGADAGSYPENNFYPPSFFEAGVVDGRITPDSPLSGMASDGTDPGADMDAIDAALPE